MKNPNIVLILSLSLTSPVFAADFTTSQICKAGIAAAFGRDPKIIKVKGSTKDFLALQYYRPSDNSLWKFHCKIVDGNQIMWRGAGDPSEPSYVGRWRDDPNDGKITYSIEKNVIKIDDITGQHTYKAAQLK